MTTPLTQLIEERKPAFKLATQCGNDGRGKTFYSVDEEDIDTLLTTAIKKGYELALEEVEKGVPKLATGIDQRSRTWIEVPDLLTHIAKLKQTP